MERIGFRPPASAALSASTADVLMLAVNLPEHVKGAIDNRCSAPSASGYDHGSLHLIHSFGLSSSKNMAWLSQALYH
jgi:hypothetical protein